MKFIWLFFFAQCEHMVGMEEKAKATARELLDEEEAAKKKLAFYY